MRRPTLTASDFAIPKRLSFGSAAIACVVLLSVVLLGYTIHSLGGTQFSWTYLMVAPILLAGVYFRAVGGIAIGAAAGLVLGPFMPLDTVAGTEQELENWLLRLAILSAVGGVVGSVCTLLVHQTHRRIWHAYFDEASGLTNASSIRERLAESGSGKEQPFALAIRITTYGATYQALGESVAQEYALTVFKMAAKAAEPWEAIPVRQDAETVVIVFPKSFGPILRQVRCVIEALPKSVRIQDSLIPVGVVSGLAKLDSAELRKQFPLENAILACDLAKRKGWRLAAYDRREEERRRQNVFLMQDLAKDLDQGNLELYFQPILSLSDDQVAGAEALLRWNSPEHGFVSPGVFIPLAEKAGLIGQVTEWVISQATDELSRWWKNGIPIYMSVNLSAQNLTDPVTRGMLLSLPRQLGSASTSIQLELTETAYLEHSRKTGEFLDRLRDAGFKIAIDDFGTGYSTLATFASLTVDTVKIDAAFVTGMLKTPALEAVVRAAIAMTGERNVKIVAEGAEDWETVERLKALGCDLVQGFVVAKPMPAAQFRDWIKSQPIPRKPKRPGNDPSPAPPPA